MRGLAMRGTRSAVAAIAGLVRPGQGAPTLALLVLWLAGCAAEKPAVAPATVVTTPASVMDLIGIDAGALERQLGKPHLIWPEEPAQVWQYRNPTCVLNVYLYRDHGRLVVSDAEARSPKHQDDTLLRCITILAETHKSATDS